MKAAIPFLLEVFTIIIVLAVILGAWGYKISAAGMEAPETPEIRIRAEYDYSNFIVNPSDRNVKDSNELNNYFSAPFYNNGDPEFCGKLKKCIKTGTRCEVDDIAFGNLANIADYKSILSYGSKNCIGEELHQRIGAAEIFFCNFKHLSSTTWREGSDANGLSFDNCTLVESGIKGDGIQSVTEEASSTKNIIYYANDSQYYQAGTYLFSPGRVKIYVGKAEADANQLCNFSLYYCFLPAIASSLDNSTVDIFDIFRYIEIYKFDEKPYYVKDISGASSVAIPGYQSELAAAYRYSGYAEKLDQGYEPGIIINAIKDGLNENWYAKYTSLGEEKRRYYWFKPFWGISTFTGGADCWSVDLTNEIKNGAVRKIYYDCGVNGVCDKGKNLKINMAFRLDNRYAARRDIYKPSSNFGGEQCSIITLNWKCQSNDKCVDRVWEYCCPATHPKYEGGYCYSVLPETFLSGIITFCET